LFPDQSEIPRFARNDRLDGFFSILPASSFYPLALRRPLPDSLRGQERLLPDALGHSRHAGGEALHIGQGFRPANQHEGPQGLKHLRFPGLDDGNGIAGADLPTLCCGQPSNFSSQG
jgi:hypothetical protein